MSLVKTDAHMDVTTVGKKTDAHMDVTTMGKKTKCLL